MIGGLVLAAGGSSRFGGEPKQLAELNGRPLVEYPVDVLAACPAIGRVVIVLGAHAERIRSDADLGSADVVIAADWREGISASLRSGIAALDGVDAVVLLLGDQPGVTAAAIDAVIVAGNSPKPAVRATYGGVPGHPVMIKRELFDEVAALDGDDGARDLLAERGVVSVECERLATGHDVDTPRDLEAIASGIPS